MESSQRPLISIIVPVYNSEQYIGDCIRSILGQTHKELQLILVNDGSTDSSSWICHEYAKSDNRVVVIDKDNGGVSSARNVGVESARGEYVGFVDSDDFIDPEMYEKLLGVLQKDNSECVVLSRYTIRKPIPGFPLDGIISPQDALEYLFELRFPTSLWAYVYRRDVINNIAFSSDVHFFEDLEFNFKAINGCKLISLCGEDLYNYRVNESSINAQAVNGKKMSCLLVYGRIFPEISGLNNPRLLDKALFFHCSFLVALLIDVGRSLSGKDERYCSEIQGQSREFFAAFVKSKSIPFLYKVAIAFAAANIRMARVTIYLLRKILMKP